MSSGDSVLVGVASVDITPPVGTPLAGFAVRVEPSAGVHDPLLSTAIAVSRGDDASVIVACDLVGLDPGDAAELADRVAEEVGVAPSQVAITVSHTHGGPKMKAVGFGTERDEEYVQQAFSGIVDAARLAWKARRPGSLRTGVARLETVAHNRRGTGVIDPLVFCAQWTDPHGQPIATVFSHACHPVTLGPDNLLITADWPGAARRLIQRSVGGEVMFVQGCCGQINTGHQATDSFRLEPDPGRTFDAAERIGERVADAVRHALRVAEPVRASTVSAQATDVWLPMEPLPTRAALRELAQQWDLEARTTSGPQRALPGIWSQWARFWLRRRPSAGGGIRVPVSVHWWGEFGIVMLPGEPFVEFALELRAALAHPDLLVMGYTGGVPGYIPLRPEDHDAGGYEIEIAYRSSQLFSGPYTKEAGPALFRAALDLARRTAP